MDSWKIGSLSMLKNKKEQRGLSKKNESILSKFSENCYVGVNWYIGKKIASAGNNINNNSILLPQKSRKLAGSSIFFWLGK